VRNEVPGARAQARANAPACFTPAVLATPAGSPAGFSFAFTGRGKLSTLLFKLTFLGAADLTGETNLAAHRFSHLR
jgi:hypothetical protein